MYGYGSSLGSWISRSGIAMNNPPTFASVTERNDGDAEAEGDGGSGPLASNEPDGSAAVAASTTTTSVAPTADQIFVAALPRPMTSVDAMLVSYQRQAEERPRVDERDKRRVGEEVEPGERPKAPGDLQLLQRFLNTWNHEFPTDWDRIGSGARATAWLCSTGLIAGSERVSDRDAARLREVREALRRVVFANGVGEPDTRSLEIVRREGRASTLRFAIDAHGGTSLVPARRGADGVVASLLGIWHEAERAGAWARLKACRQCEYVFFDRSKNRSAAWCAMAICGNRTKNRAYRRRRALRSSTRSPS